MNNSLNRTLIINSDAPWNVMLRMAILEQAVADYSRAAHGDPAPHRYCDMESLEQFFASDWGRAIVGSIDINPILAAARERVYVTT